MKATYTTPKISTEELTRQDVLTDSSIPASLKKKENAYKKSKTIASAPTLKTPLDPDNWLW